MGKKDPRVDAYIDKSAEFAKPVLNHLRELVHQGCPEVEEEIKWGFPHFTYKGMFCGMAAFNKHCTLGFWKSKLIFKETKVAGKRGESAMGQMGRITSLSDLPGDKVLLGYIKKAVQLNDDGITRPAKPRSAKKKELVIPPEFMSALKGNKKALGTFESLSYTHKKEYVEWYAEAKGEDTRAWRLQNTLQWLSEGKTRNWKYANC
ncbi:MAG: hypothetical protein JWR26_999 [Pedosphaera sp.]|nr:hypothetical protein [Pedosphaera sp.]